MSLFIRCDYKEFKPKTYKGIYVEDGRGKELFRSNTGYDEEDLEVVLEWIHRNKNHHRVYETSSVLDYSIDLQSKFKKRNWALNPWTKEEAMAYRNGK